MAPFSSEKGEVFGLALTFAVVVPRLGLGGSPPSLPMVPVGTPLMGETRISSLKQKVNTCGAGKQHRSVQLEEPFLRRAEETVCTGVKQRVYGSYGGEPSYLLCGTKPFCG